MSLKLIKTLCETDTDDLEILLFDFLAKNYARVISKDGYYMFAEGNIPVCLIAHIDTVSLDYYNSLPNMCLYDNEQDIFHVVGGGTLDDRLGIYMILRIIQSEYKPSIIFTNGEELGGFGAEQLIKDYLSCPFDINFIIELDRKGKNDSVYYTCNNKNFQNYINSFGFKTAIGTFTDCLIIGEAWNIAAVNLSCGYELEHSIYEYAHLNWTEKNIQKVKKILDDWVGAKNDPSLKMIYNIKEK